MKSIVELSRSDKRKLRIWIPRETDAGMRTRMSMILHLSKGKAVAEVAESLHVARSTVYRVADRFRQWGWIGLADAREDNGSPGVDAMFLLHLRGVVAGTPQDYGWARPTWTQELLREVLAQRTGRRVSQATMSRCLKAIGARLVAVATRIAATSATHSVVFSIALVWPASGCRPRVPWGSRKPVVFNEGLVADS